MLCFYTIIWILDLSFCLAANNNTNTEKKERERERKPKHNGVLRDSWVISLHFMSLPTKRSGGASTTPMKKAKSIFDPSSNDAVLDPSLSLSDLKPDLPNPRGAPMAANLARKKATPPQPKKLLIKFTKGFRSLFFDFQGFSVLA